MFCFWPLNVELAEAENPFLNFETFCLSLLSASSWSSLTAGPPCSGCHAVDICVQAGPGDMAFTAPHWVSHHHPHPLPLSLTRQSSSSARTGMYLCVYGALLRVYAMFRSARFRSACCLCAQRGGWGWGAYHLKRENTVDQETAACTNKSVAQSQCQNTLLTIFQYNPAPSV